MNATCVCSSTMKSRSVFALSVCLFLLFGLVYLSCTLLLRENVGQPVPFNAQTTHQDNRSRDVPNDNRKPIKKGWIPGRKYTMVDIQQRYVKHEGHSKHLPRMRVSHTILHFNKDARNYGIETDNNVIKSECLYSNCMFTSDTTILETSSAVIFHMTKGGTLDADFTPPGRTKGQIWILSDLQPRQDKVDHSHFNHEEWKRGINWTLSYRLDSDILWTPGTLRTRKSEVVIQSDYLAPPPHRPYFAMAMITNCSSYEQNGLKGYLKRLKRHIEVDVYGECEETIIVKDDVKKTVLQYKYLLIFNEVSCQELIPQSFYGMYEHEIVLVVHGGDYDRLLPKDTFIKADEFRDIPSLAKHLHTLAEDSAKYEQYLRNKRFYEVAPGVRWQCDLCEKVNNKYQNKYIYEDIVLTLDNTVCYQPPYIRKHSPLFVKVTIVFGVIVFFVTQFWKYCLRFYCRNEDGKCKISYFD